MSTEDVAKTLLSSSGRLDGETETFVAHTLKAEGHDASEDGTGRNVPFVLASGQANAGLVRDGSPALTCLADVPIVCHAFEWQRGASQNLEVMEEHVPALIKSQTPAVAFSCKDHGADADDIARSVGAMSHSGSHANAGGQVAVAFDTTQITSPSNYSNPKPGEPCHPLAAGAHPPAVAFAQRGREHGAVPEVHGDGQTASALRAASGGSSRDMVAGLTMQVRRLTPMECERLQGFPDDYTAIPWRGKNGTPDGPRYKALGNSMAVPVMRWIGKRIDDCLKTP